MKNGQKQRLPEELHQRQTWLEIWLPLILGIAICSVILILVILAAIHGSGSVAQLSAISIILMIAPSLLITLLSIAIIVFLDYWVIKGNHAIPAFGVLLRHKVNTVTSKIQQILFSITSTVINIRAGLDSIKHFFRSKKSNN
jgi:hypothetical protein